MNKPTKNEPIRLVAKYPVIHGICSLTLEADHGRITNSLDAYELAVKTLRERGIKDVIEIQVLYNHDDSSYYAHVLLDEESDPEQFEV